MSESGISQAGTVALKQILWIRDNIDYEKYLLGGDKNKKTPPPLSPQTIENIKNPDKGWPVALGNLIDQFNLNRNDVTLAARLFGIQINPQNPRLKARQFSETVLNEPGGASDLFKAIGVVKSSRISAKRKVLLLQILHIRDNIDYEKYLLGGDKTKKTPPPLSPQTIEDIKNPDKGWPVALGNLIDQFNLNRNDVTLAARLFGIQINPQNPRLKARQFSESTNGLNIKKDSSDLKIALCAVDPGECRKTPDRLEPATSELVEMEKRKGIKGIAMAKAEIKRGRFHLAYDLLMRSLWTLPENRTLPEKDQAEVWKLTKQLETAVFAEKIAEMGNPYMAKNEYEKIKDLNPAVIGKRISDLNKVIKRIDAFVNKEERRLPAPIPAPSPKPTPAPAPEPRPTKIAMVQPKPAEKTTSPQNTEKINSEKVAPSKELGLDETVVAYHIKKNVGQIREPYENALKKNRGLKGSVKFKLEINPNGSIGAVQLLENKDKMPPDFINSVMAIIKKWRFPAAGNGARTVSELGYVFKPEEITVKESSEENMKLLAAVRKAIAKASFAEAEATLAKIKINELSDAARSEVVTTQRNLDQWKLVQELEKTEYWMDAQEIYRQLYQVNRRYIGARIKELDKKIAKMTEAQKQNSLASLEDITKKNPTNVTLLNKLGWALIRNKKYDEAVRTFNKLANPANGLDKYNADNHYGTSIVRYYSNQCDLAKIAFNEAVRWDISYKNKPQPWIEKPCK